MLEVWPVFERKSTATLTTGYHADWSIIGNGEIVQSGTWHTNRIGFVWTGRRFTPVERLDANQTRLFASGKSLCLLQGAVAMVVFSALLRLQSKSL